MDKLATPNLPTTKHIIEDITNPVFTSKDLSKELALNDKQLTNAYTCLINLKQLADDIKNQSELNSKLEELNKTLIENIASLKTQAARKG